MKKFCLKPLVAALVSCAATWVLPSQAYDLKEAAQEAALNNPEVLAKWHAYREATEAIRVAQGGYLPKVDAGAYIRREHLNQSGTDTRYTTSGFSIYLTQMLFDGFATKREVERYSYAQRVRYYELMDATEGASLEVARAYFDVLRYRKLVDLTQENYIQHRALYEQINRRVKAGVGRQVDLEQAGGRLALAESNLLVETSNLHDVSARFQRIVGKTPPASMNVPALLGKGIPSSRASAVLTGYEYNPSLLAAQENIMASTSEARGADAAFMPKLYFRAGHDNGKNVDGVDGRTRNTNYGLQLNMNLYNGGSDLARQRQYGERVNIAKYQRDKVCRDIRQSVSIAMNDVTKLAEQIEYLDQHQLSIEKARDAYRKQFDIGQRSLLDLLDTENELFNSRRAYQNGLHDQMYAYARTQAGMGKLLEQLGLQKLDTEKLAEQSEKAAFDPQAVCPAEGDLVTPVNKDQIFANALRTRPELMPPVQAAAPRPAAAAVPSNRYVVYFDTGSAALRPDAQAELRRVAEVAQRPGVQIVLVGHADTVGATQSNADLSDRRVKAVAYFLKSHGVNAPMSMSATGETNLPIQTPDETAEQGNRTVEIHLR